MSIAKLEAIRIDGTVAKLSKVKFLVAANKRFDLLVIEEALYHQHVNNTGESFLKRGKLAFTLLDKLEINVESDELLHVVGCDEDLGAILFQFDL